MEQQYFAFLRAINVGGHTVKMDGLRQLFESLGFSDVKTYIASGNIVFTTGKAEPAALETLIEDTLLNALGFPVTTFIRTPAELAAAAARQPFAAELFERAAAFNVAFLKSPASPAAIEKLAGMENEIDTFHVKGREVYWLCQVLQSQSKFSNAALEKILGQPATMRNVNTIKKMVDNYLQFNQTS